MMVTFEGRSVFSSQAVAPSWFYKLLRQMDSGQLLPRLRGANFAVAVSGGGDSMALAWLLRRYGLRGLAIVIDHGLRRGSYREAHVTAQRLSFMGYEVCLRRLPPFVGEHALEERARKARYKALFEICRVHQCDYLFTAHQADDQVETFRRRQAFHSGADGLAGIGWSSKREGIYLVRPLLAVSRQALRQTLRHHQGAWFDDPTNVLTERGKMRRTWGRVVHKEALWAASMRFGFRRMRRHQQTSLWLKRKAVFYRQGWVDLGPTLPPSFILSRVLHAYNGRSYPPSPMALRRFLDQSVGGTLGGMRFIFWKQHWFMIREYADLPSPKRVREGVSWDQCYRVESVWPRVADLFIGAAGLGIKREIRGGWPASFCATTPCLFSGKERVALPFLGWCSQSTDSGVHISFHPPALMDDGALFGARSQDRRNYFF